MLTLTKNMRLLTTSSSTADQELKDFVDWIIKIGEGKLVLDNDGIIEVEIP